MEYDLQILRLSPTQPFYLFLGLLFTCGSFGQSGYGWEPWGYNPYGQNSGGYQQYQSPQALFPQYQQNQPFPNNQQPQYQQNQPFPNNAQTQNAALNSQKSDIARTSQEPAATVEGWGKNQPLPQSNTPAACPAKPPFPEYVERTTGFDPPAVSRYPILKASMEYKSDSDRQGRLSLYFRKEDVNRCVKWNAWDLTYRGAKGELWYYRDRDNKPLRATTIRFEYSMKQDSQTWARVVGFFKDEDCRKVIGIGDTRKEAGDGRFERPALLSLDQADNSAGSDPGRSSIYIQGTLLPTEFFTLLMGPSDSPPLYPTPESNPIYKIKDS